MNGNTPRLFFPRPLRLTADIVLVSALSNWYFVKTNKQTKSNQKPLCCSTYFSASFLVLCRIGTTAYFRELSASLSHVARSPGQCELKVSILVSGFSGDLENQPSPWYWSGRKRMLWREFDAQCHLSKYTSWKRLRPMKLPYSCQYS